MASPQYPDSPEIFDLAPAGLPESDIADQYNTQNITTSEEIDIPPRPGTPLGFNRKGGSSCQTSSRRRSRLAPMKWTCNLFHKMGISSTDVRDEHLFSASQNGADMDTNSLSPASSAISHPTRFAPPSPPLSLESMEDWSDPDISLGYLSCSDDESNDSDDDDDIEIDLDIIPGFESLTSDSQPLLPVAGPSRFPCPVAPTSPDTPSNRPKYSCLPSPFSPNAVSTSAFQYSPSPPRHHYQHRGYSRHGLLHTKWFWAVREEEWADYTASSAYGGITLPPNPLRRLHGRSSRFSPQQPQSEERPLPPLTIHPRRGDISALRDPYCAHMDRYFVGVPLWTIAKTLWMFDVCKAVEGRLKEQEDSGEISDTDSCEELMSMSVLTGFSDDSDVTLVEESDTEGRMSPGGSDESSDGTIDITTTASQSDESDEEDYMFLEEVDLNDPPSASSSSSTLASTATRQRSHRHSTSKKQSRVPAPSLWETDWYRRFDLLFQLTKFDAELQQTQTTFYLPALLTA